MNCDPERKHDRPCFCILIMEEFWEMFLDEKTKHHPNHKVSTEYAPEKRKFKQVD